MYTSMFRKAMLGDTATLNLDFTTGVLDSRLTFTRASTATYINSSGYVTTMGAAPTNDPTKARFDYDPVTLAPRGLLIEGTSINIIRYSAAPQSWSAAVSGTTITDGSGLAPDNSSTPKQLAMTSGAYCYQVTQSNQVAGTYTYSVWLKASSAQSVGVRVSRTSDGSVKGMITAAVTTTWKRFEVQITSNATDTLDCGFDQRSIPPSVPGPGVAATFLMWNAQLEAGAGASSSIATGASQVTRNADSCLMSGTNFSSWYTHGIGTVCWSGSAFRVTAGHLANINTVNNDPRITAYVGAGSLSNLVTNGTTQASISFGSVTANTAFKAAWRFNTNDFAACLNAGTVQTDTVGTVPTGVDRMQLGAAEGGYQFLDGWIKSIKYYPTAFTNAELQTATTL